MGALVLAGLLTAMGGSHALGQDDASGAKPLVRTRGVALAFHAQGENGNELPRDGASGCVTTATTEWDLPSPANWTEAGVQFISADIASGMRFDPMTAVLPLTAGRHMARARYVQPEDAFPGDTTLVGRAQTWGKHADAPLTLRGVQLVARRFGADRLIAGAATRRSATTLVVKAWCPTARGLKPQGVVTASITGLGPRPRIKRATPDGPVWRERLSVPLSLMRWPDDSGGDGFMGASFTIAADCPYALAGWQSGIAQVFFQLNDTHIHTLASVPVDVPTYAEITWDGEGQIGRRRGCIGGTLKWYADEERTTLCPGVRGRLVWYLPQGTVEDEYATSDDGVAAYRFRSPDLSAAGVGGLYVSSESGHNGNWKLVVVKGRVRERHRAQVR